MSNQPQTVGQNLLILPDHIAEEIENFVSIDSLVACMQHVQIAYRENCEEEYDRICPHNEQGYNLIISLLTTTSEVRKYRESRFAQCNQD